MYHSAEAYEDGKVRGDTCRQEHIVHAFLTRPTDCLVTDAHRASCGNGALASNFCHARLYRTRRPPASPGMRTGARCAACKLPTASASDGRGPSRVSSRTQ